MMYVLVVLAAGVCLHAAEATSPDPVASAKDSLKHGRADEAIAVLEPEIRSGSATASAFVVYVDALRHAERFREADVAIASGLSKYAQDSEVQRAKGDLEFREGHIGPADQAFKASVKLNPDNTRALLGISRLFNAACLRHKAALLIEKAHEIDPNDPAINARFAGLETDPAKQLKTLEAALLIAPPDSDEAGYIQGEIKTLRALQGHHPLELASEYKHYDNPFIPLYNGRQIYGVSIAFALNGVKNDLQLDTGASGLLISEKFAEKAGVERLGDSRIGGIGNQGWKDSWTGIAKTLTIGDLEFHNIIVEVTRKMDQRGLFGTDVFHQFQVTLDFKQRRLKLDPLPGPKWDGYSPVDRYTGPETKDWSQYFLIHHYLLVPGVLTSGLKQDAEIASGLFLMDTGAALDMVSSTVAPQIAKVRDSDERVRGLSGDVKKVYSTSKVWLAFAKYRQENVDMTTFDMSHTSRSAGCEVIGIIGLPLLVLFDSVTIDYRDGMVKFVRPG